MSKQHNEISLEIVPQVNKQYYIGFVWVPVIPFTEINKIDPVFSHFAETYNASVTSMRGEYIAAIIFELKSVTDLTLMQMWEETKTFALFQNLDLYFGAAWVEPLQKEKFPWGPLGLIGLTAVGITALALPKKKE